MKSCAWEFALFVRESGAFTMDAATGKVRTTLLSAAFVKTGNVPVMFVIPWSAPV